MKKKKQFLKRNDRFSEIAFFANQAKNSANAYLGNGLLVTRIFTGQKMFVNAQDLSLTPHLLIDGIWEPDITPFFLDLLKDDDVVKLKKKTESKFKKTLETLSKQKPANWFAYDATNLSWSFLHQPQRDEVDVPVDEQLIVEFYSR